MDKQGQTASHSQVRRFDVKSFAFVDPQSGLPSAEEVRSSPTSTPHTYIARLPFTTRILSHQDLLLLLGGNLHRGRRLRSAVLHNL